MLPAAIQILAFGLALLGVLGATAATLLPNWTVSVGGAWSGVMSPATRTRGLWMDCVWFGSGLFSCGAENPPSPPLQAARAAMLLSLLVALLGLCLASLGLKCTQWGGGRLAKARTAAAAGGCFLLSGLLCAGPASWVTSAAVGALLRVDRPDGFRPGGALGLSFVSAGFLLTGGVIFCLSCPRKTSRRPGHAERRQSLRTEATKGGGARRVQLRLEVRDSYSLQEYV